jgi:phage terminase large subunit-like protein
MIEALDSETELKRQRALLLKAKEQYIKYNFAESIFPATGPYSRDKYKKHLELIKATATHNFCLFGAGNQLGKTLTAAFIIRTVATGKYPDWWEGRRWDRPVNILIASVTPAQIRKAIQTKLFGRFSDMGTGMLSKDDITDRETGELMTWNMPGTSNTVVTAEVNHVSGGKSIIEVLTYNQGRDVFQGNTSDIVLFDEEPEHYSIYAEAVRGIIRNNGLFILTFTPLKGLTKLLSNFLPNNDRYFEGEHPDEPHRYICRAGVRDVPHFSESAIKAAESEYEPHLREARLYGVPCMGMGSVYPINEDSLIVDAFEIPENWKCCYGMDFGWHNTAVVFIAKNPVTGIYYIYDEYKRGQVVADIHANAIMKPSRAGQWMRGGCDPAGNKTEADGSTYITTYKQLGLKLVPGVAKIAIGTQLIYSLMEAGLLKIMSHCTMLLAELRSYQYDEKNPNKIKDDQDDHLLDAMKYGFSVFSMIARSREDVYEDEHQEFLTPYNKRGNGDDDVFDELIGY